MTGLIPATHAVKMEEPCFLLTEQNLQRPDSRGWRRYQIMYVVRNDRLAEFRKDLGPARSFSTEVFRILGGVRDEQTGRIHILHTVGELVDIAEFFRAGLHHPPQIEPSDLIGGYHRHQEERRRRVRQQRQFGQHARIQRS